MASLALPASGALRIWLPHTTASEQVTSINRLLPTATRPMWEPAIESWTVPKGQFLTVVDRLLGRHPHLMLGRAYNAKEKCNSSCKNAQGLECTCSCRAKYHGGGRWMKGFTTVAEFGTQHDRESWHWMVVTAR